MAFTDQQILNQMQYAMIETPNSGASWGSGFWSAAEVINYLNHRQNRFLNDSYLQIGIANIDATQGVNTYDLPDDWIITTSVIWIDTDGSTHELIASSVWEADHGIPTWSYVQGVPKIYTDVDTPLTTIKIAPLPNAAGTIQVHFVPTAVLLDGTGELMTLPDEFISAVKYGAMSDMLNKVGRATDPIRAEYCKRRYELGIEIAKMLLKGWRA